MNDAVSSTNADRCIYLDQKIWQRLETHASQQDFCGAWIELQCALFTQFRGGIVVLRDEDKYAQAACWPDDLQADALLADAAERALKRESGVVLQPEDGEQGFTGIAYPVFVNDVQRGAVAMMVAPCSDNELQLLMRMIQWGIAWIENFFLHRMEGPSIQSISHSGQSLDMLAVILEKNSFEDAAEALANAITAAMKCDKVSLAYVKKGKARICTVSHNANFDNKMNLIRTLELAMDEAIVQKESLLYPAQGDSTSIVRDHAAYASKYGVAHVMTLVMGGPDKILGAVTMERQSNPPFSTEERVLAESMLALVGPVLSSKKELEKHILVKTFDSFKTQASRMFGPKYLVRKMILSSLSLAVLFFSFADGVYRVSADAEIEGAIRRSIAAPFDGYIAKAFFRAGDRVRKGDILCLMDDREIRLERSKWSSKLNQFTDQYHEALAKHDKAEIGIAKSKVAQAVAQLELTKQQLERTKIEAPFGGLIVSGDLNQALGSAKRKGDVLFDISPLDTYRVNLMVPEEDINDVAQDQHGQLHLASMPGQIFKLSVNKITPVNTVRDGGNFFRVEAGLDATSDLLRPGMKGVAKVEIGQRRLIWIWTHKLLDWLRLSIWSWWP